MLILKSSPVPPSTLTSLVYFSKGTVSKPLESLCPPTHLLLLHVCDRQCLHCVALGPFPGTPQPPLQGSQAGLAPLQTGGTGGLYS